MSALPSVALNEARQEREVNCWRERVPEGLKEEIKEGERDRDTKSAPSKSKDMSGSDTTRLGMGRWTFSDVERGFVGGWITGGRFGVVIAERGTEEESWSWRRSWRRTKIMMFEKYFAGRLGNGWKLKS